MPAVHHLLSLDIGLYNKHEDRPAGRSHQWLPAG
jgi:hypothetical protein